MGRSHPHLPDGRRVGRIGAWAAEVSVTARIGGREVEPPFAVGSVLGRPAGIRRLDAAGDAAGRWPAPTRRHRPMLGRLPG